jgi:hypothetical protein
VKLPNAGLGDSGAIQLNLAKVGQVLQVRQPGITYLGIVKLQAF